MLGVDYILGLSILCLIYDCYMYKLITGDDNMMMRWVLSLTSKRAHHYWITGWGELLAAIDFRINCIQLYWWMRQ